MTARYEVRIKRSAEKELRAIAPPHRGRLIQAIQHLAHEPRPHGALKMAGRDAWRVRVGSYRVVYTVEDSALIIEVVRVAHRRGVYR